MKKMLLKGLVISVAVLFVTGCMSSKRMMRISPLSEEINDELSSTNRTNTWPIYYHDNGMHSLLWPFIDWDQNGFAFRPIYNQEGSDKSVLWPLSGWNSEKGDGWALTAYWDKNYHGLFPIYHYTPEELSYYLLYWRNGRDAQGLLPLFGYSDKYCHFLNVYWGRGDKSDVYGMFPFYLHSKKASIIPLIYNRHSSADKYDYMYLLGLAARFSKDKKSQMSYVVPFWYNQKYANGAGLKAITPFYWNWKSAENNSSSLLFPFYYRSSTPTTSRFHTLLGHSVVKENSESFAVYPLFFKGNNPKMSYNFLIPLYYNQVVDGESLFVTPLGGFSYDPTGKHKFTNILGPIYINREDSDYYFNSVLWPFYVSHGDKSYSSRWLFPVFRSKKDSEEESLNVMLFAYHSESNKNGEFWKHICWPFYIDNGDAKKRNTYYTPLYMRHHTEDLDKHLLIFGLGKYEECKKGTGYRVWPFASGYDYKNKFNLFDYTVYGMRKRGKKTTNWLCPFYYGWNRENQTDRQFLLSIARSYSNGETYRRSLWPFLSVSTATENKNFWDDLGLFLFETHNYKEQRQSGWSTLGILGYCHEKRFHKDADESSSKNHFLLFGIDKSNNYNQKQIPEPLSSNYQRTIKSDEFNFLFYSDSENHFRVWKNDALTDEEMKTICRWVYKTNQRFGVKRTKSSSISFDENSGEYFSYYTKENEDALRKKVQDILTKYGIDYKSGTKEELRSAVEELAEQKSRIKVESNSSFWPFYDYSSSEGNHKFEFLFGVAHSKRVGDKSRASVLKYLYRREQDGENIRRDIFPFISVDSGENGGHSFLGKFWNFRKGKESRYGNFLFIPWGKHPEDN